MALFGKAKTRWMTDQIPGATRTEYMTICEGHKKQGPSATVSVYRRRAFAVVKQQK